MSGIPLSDIGISYQSLLDYIRRNDRLRDAHTPLLNVQQGYERGFGDHNQLLRDAIMAQDFFGILPTRRSINRWTGTEPSPNERVSEGFGDAQRILGWENQNSKRRDRR